MTRWLERAAIVIVSLAIAIGVIALLSGGLAGEPGRSGGTGGQQGPGHGLPRPGRPAPAARASRVRTTTPTRRRVVPHMPVNVVRDRADDLRRPAASGAAARRRRADVRHPQPPPGLAAVAEAVGAAVHARARGLRRRGDPRPPTRDPGVIALAWTAHAARVADLSDSPAWLRASIEYRLGPRGAGVELRRAAAEIVTRLSTHSRPSVVSDLDLPHPGGPTAVTGARGRRGSCPPVIGRRKLVCVESPSPTRPSAATAESVPATARDSAIAA